MKRRRCKICGRNKPLPDFFGRYDTVCKECSFLPRDKQNEMELLSLIRDLPDEMNETQLEWLEGLRSDPRESVRMAVADRLSRGED